MAKRRAIYARAVRLSFVMSAVGLTCWFPAMATTINTPCGNVPALISNINAASTGDVVTLCGNYTLTTINNVGPNAGGNGLPVISGKAITLLGLGAGAAIVRSGASTTPDFRILFVAADGELTLKKVMIAGGRLYDNGGGIFNRGRLKLEESSVENNRGDGGAGIYNNKVVELIKSTVRSNVDRFFGAGIYNDGGVATLTVRESAIVLNDGRLRASGIHNDAGVVDVINSTVSHNRNGRGVMSDGGGRVTLIHTTVFGNTPHPTEGGGGVVSFRDSVVTLKNTIVANNGAPDCRADAAPPIVMLGVNFIGDGSCPSPFTGNPLLGPLALNGGPTLNHKPNTVSPVVNKVPPAVCTDKNGVALTADQRNPNIRPNPPGFNCDIGSVER